MKFNLNGNILKIEITDKKKTPIILIKLKEWNLIVWGGQIKLNWVKSEIEINLK